MVGIRHRALHLALYVTIAVLGQPGATAAPLPTVAFVAPQANAKISADGTGSVLVSGTASDSGTLARVELSLTNEDGTVSGLVANGTTAWSLSVADIIPGVNTITATAFNTTGGVSKVVSRSFTYLQYGPLDQSASTGGHIASAVNLANPLQLARSYQVMAVAAPGSVFQSWSVKTPDSDEVQVSLSPTLKFVMREGLSIHAKFIPNPFPSRVGTFNGLLRSPGNSTVGFVTVTLSASGSFTGKVMLGMTGFAVQGRFDHAGDAAFEHDSAADEPILLFLHLGVEDSESGLFASVVQNGETIATMAVPHGTVPLAGTKYTLVLRPDIQRTNSPQGYGYATGTATAAGKVSWVGKLADGHMFSWSSFVDANAHLPMFVQLKLGESLVGELLFTQAASDDLRGLLAWDHPAMPLDPGFKAPFFAASDTFGSVYHVPRSGVSILPFGAATPNGQFSANGPSLPTSAAEDVTLNTRSQVLAPVDAAKLKLTVTLKTGLFSGSFIGTDSTTPRKFAGVVLQTQGYGAGFFLDPSQAGSVFLESK